MKIPELSEHRRDVDDRRTSRSEHEQQDAAHTGGRRGSEDRRPSIAVEQRTTRHPRECHTYNERTEDERTARLARAVTVRGGECYPVVRGPFGERSSGQ